MVVNCDEGSNEYANRFYLLLIIRLSDIFSAWKVKTDGRLNISNFKMPLKTEDSNVLCTLSYQNKHSANTKKKGSDATAQLEQLNDDSKI